MCAANVLEYDDIFKLSDPLHSEHAAFFQRGLMDQKGTFIKKKKTSMIEYINAEFKPITYS